MKKSEVAQLMYDLQEYCKEHNCIGCSQDKYDLCHNLSSNDRSLKPPMDWGITRADIERLKKKEYECK